MKQYEGSLHGKDVRVAIVVSRFNRMITRSLLEGALSGLRENEVDDMQVPVAWVPGALEIPIVASRFAHSGNFDVIICLGAVIRGETYHFEVVSNQSAQGITAAALASGIPIINGVLTVDSVEQAIERSSNTFGNKGRDAAISALEMANLFKEIGDRRQETGDRRQ